MATSKRLRHQIRHQLAEWRQKIALELVHDTVSGVSEGNQINLYFEGDATYNAMLRSIGNARHFVHMEMYMFLSDTTGQQFADAMIAKAREGISVRVIYDAIGSSGAEAKQWQKTCNARIVSPATGKDYAPGGD